MPIGESRIGEWLATSHGRHLVAFACVLLAACGKERIDFDLDAGASTGGASSRDVAGRGGSSPTTGGGGASTGGDVGSVGVGGVGGFGVGGAGGLGGSTGTGGGAAGVGGAPTDRDSGLGGTGGADAGSACIDTCFAAGGQYCGRIGDNCGRTIECGGCSTPGFVCGGAGVPGVCGAAPDSGVCPSTVCKEVSGQYCGVVGNGCGGDIDCGLCSVPESCGGRGVPNVCGFIPDLCVPVVCDFVPYCGVIGNGCGDALDCGACPSGTVCGPRRPHVCGLPCPLCAQIETCSDGGLTTISGTVTTASLDDPHPVVANVYIPNIAPGTTLTPLPDGPSCPSCSVTDYESVIATTVSQPDGKFVLSGVPFGSRIPLVIEIGKWRRQIAVDVTPCTDNVLPAGTARLPRNHNEGEIPLTAILTGNVDRTQCLLRKMGIDDAEFSNPTGPGRIHFYRSNGSRIDAETPDAAAFEGADGGSSVWSRYSQVLLPCEGAEISRSPAMLADLTDYVNRGGRVFATHFSYTWLATNGAFAGIGNWTPNAVQPPSPFSANVLTSTPATTAFASWLKLVGALSSDSPPQVIIVEPRADLVSLTSGSPATAWMQSDLPATTQLVTIETPIATPNASCGRVAFSDFHMASAMTSTSTFPAECENGPMTPTEKVLEYVLLDLGACRAGSNKGRPPIPDPPPAPRQPPPTRQPPPPPPPPVPL